jgi:hypothetical protein
LLGFFIVPVERSVDGLISRSGVVSAMTLAVEAIASVRMIAISESMREMRLPYW